MFNFKDTGSLKATEKFLTSLQRGLNPSELDKYGQMGVDALARATPTDTGKTARSWTYKIFAGKYRTTIVWYNTNVNRGAPIAIMLQYGHGTGTGGWVAGYDYINPAMRPIFDKIADEIWKKVKNA